MANIIEQVTNHLEFLGFTASPTQKGFYAFTHSMQPGVVIVDSDVGLIHYAMFGLNSRGKNNIQKVLERINLLNQGARVCSCHFDGNKVFFKGFFPKLYEKSAYGTFIQLFLSEVGFVNDENVQLIEYLE